MQSPNVRGFFDPATATWTYVVWSASDPAKHCAIIDSVLDYDMFSSTSSTASADIVIDFIGFCIIFFSIFQKNLVDN